ncbi:YlqD family protein [Oceanobacillus kimchii]|uniref:YlqD family protein n=1 Tax=Oceanobacillus kimchii TaxID=746691 RepID=UPI0003451C2A|nr:YlqD family protein [Oceanobacillus kimchii]
MKIVKKITVKQVVTETSKQRIYQGFYNHKLRLEQECQQLKFEKRKLQHKASVNPQEIEDRFEQEINNRKEKIKLLDFKIEQLNEIQIGSEIIEDEVEALVEVEVGTNWSKLMKEQAIIIKDDKVIRIDE